MKTGSKIVGAALLAFGLASLAFAAGSMKAEPSHPATAMKPAEAKAAMHSSAEKAESHLKTMEKKSAGLSHAQATEVQKALAAKGYHIKADGKWGKWSRKTLAEFQKKHGLKATGYPDAKTRKALGLG